MARMIPIRADRASPAIPLVTYTIILLNVIVYFWDRQGSLTGPSVTFADLGMRPQEVVQAITGSGDRFPLVTLFTSLFLHGSLVHLLGNMIYLFTFGPGIEAALGSPRYSLYYLFWGLLASGAHIAVDPTSAIPTIGASGAIGGVLGCYFLLFPTHKIELLIPFFVVTVEVVAWVLLGTWFLWQLLFKQEGVATWAHAGGFVAGMLTILILGGRRAVLKGREWMAES